MRAKILIVCKERKRRNTVFRAIASGCEKVNLDTEMIILAKDMDEATRKLTMADANVILCDIALAGWKELQRIFNSGKNTKLFILFFGQENSMEGRNYSSAPEICDGAFCEKTLTGKISSVTVCDMIAELTSRRKAVGSK
jgi:hypothetical protein